MPAIIKSILQAAPAAHVEAALARLAQLAPAAAPEIAHACVACGSTAVELVEFDKPSSWSEEGESAAAWHCSQCGANESDVAELVVMPAATFAAMTAIMDAAVPLAGTAMQPTTDEMLRLSLELVAMRRAA